MDEILASMADRITNGDISRTITTLEDAIGYLDEAKASRGAERATACAEAIKLIDSITGDDEGGE